MESFYKIATLKEHEGDGTHITSSEDDSIIISVDDVGKIKVWDVNTYKELKDAEIFEKMKKCRVSKIVSLQKNKKNWEKRYKKLPVYLNKSLNLLITNT